MTQENVYANLEIRILKREAEGYPVELTLDGSQQFGGGYLKSDLLPWAPTASPEDDGERLFNHLFGHGRLRQQWAEIRGRHSLRRVRLRIDTNAPELHAIPWELLRDTTAADEPQTLAATMATPFSRYIAGTWQPGRPISKRPIKILVAIANPHNLPDFGLSAIEVDEEWRLIQEATERLEVALVQLPQPCTLSVLETALKEGPHILHFVGHGAYSKKLSQAQLYLADPDNCVSLVSEAEFAAMISRQSAGLDEPGDDRLRLVFLASCQTATRSPADAFRGFAPALVKAGVPAVLAMQDLIPVETARTFSRVFYAELLEHGQVDRACNGARAALMTGRLPGNSIPVLFSRLIDNQLLAPSLLIHEQAYRERVRDRYAEMVRYFIELINEAVEGPATARPAPVKLATPDLAHLLELTEYHELRPTGLEIKRVKLKSLREGVERYPCIILLGDPGAGKTTALEHLAFQLADEREKLPLPLRLSEFSPGMTLAGFIKQSLGGATGWDASTLADNLDTYLEEGRLFFLFDALNEMPREGYQTRVRELRDFIDRWQERGNRFLVTCRVLDYGEELSGLQRVEVQPFNDEQIEALLTRLMPGQWETFWQVLTSSQEAEDRRWLRMAHNPYLLTRMIYVFIVEGKLGQNRAELLDSFVRILLAWAEEKCPSEQWLEAEAQQEVISIAAFEMQKRAGSGAAVKTSMVKTVMPAQVQPDPNWPPVVTPPDQVLSLAASANIVEMPVDRSSVRFYHQLLQEYFAARQMLKSDRSRLPELWRWPWWLEEDMPLWVRPEDNFDPLPPPPQTGWEETTILAAGLAPENDDQLVRALIKVNPVLAGRCLHEGQAKVDQAIRQEVIKALLDTIAQPEVALRVRIEAGNILGYLGDPRLGEMVMVPAGEFVMGTDGGGLVNEKPQHRLFLPDYQLGKYPLTNVEYKQFIEASGYQEKRWWTQAGWAWRIRQNRTEPYYWDDSRFNKPNQPVMGVSWNECVAYCRWRSAETGQLYRLPTEAEWEKGARGVDGRQYPWGDKFEASRLNAREGEQQLRTTTPVGIYPTGASPFGAFDCAGNVFEWCATKAGEDFYGPEFKPYPYDILEDEWSSDYLERIYVRVLRGGSWDEFRLNARCPFRAGFYTDFLIFNVGCRVLVSPRR